MIHNKSKMSMRDLVCPHIYEIYGEGAKMFIDNKLLDFLDKLKNEVFAGRYVIVNTWDTVVYDSAIRYSQRGLYCNVCSKLKFYTRLNNTVLNSHILGRAIDFTIMEESGAFWDNEEVISRIQSSASFKDESYTIKKYDTYVHLSTVDLNEINKE